MSGNPEDAWLIALGAAVSDGTQVDWDDVEKRQTTPEQQRLVQELRQLATIVNAQRTAGAGRDQTGDADSESVSARASQWRHLVLFECVGTGAFGSVYRGWDPQLDREVAVKLLPKAKAGAVPPLDEARHLARIRHSNIVVVHGADEDAERAGIWMEYIEGETLAAIVRERGPMSAREAAGVGLDLCSAVSAIHAAGLLHRDIKAQNVMREVGGRIVLMDFSGAQGVRAGAASPVLSGTPLYMAPELLEGAPPSTASDVYSLGVLLFYLLSGGLPIEGVTIDDVRQAHIRGERKRLRDVRPDLPDGLVKVIERATAHEPDVRFRTAGELEHALANASGVETVVVSAGATGSKGPARLRGWQRWVLGSAVLLLMIAAGLGAFGLWPPSRPPDPLVARFQIGPPFLTGSWPRISPDGRLVVFGTMVEGRSRFWIRPLDAIPGRPLMHTTAKESPFWSPDSETLCFFDEGKLYRISVIEGPPQLLADAPRPHGGDWSGDTIIYARDDGIYRIGANGGTPQRLTVVDQSAGDYEHAWPEFLPDGRRFLYVARSDGKDRSGIYLSSLDNPAPRRLLPAYSRVVYASNHLLYVRDSTLVAHPFDPRTATLIGEPVSLANNVKHHVATDAAFDVSDTGVLVFTVEFGQPLTRLVLHDIRGRELRTLTDVGSFAEPRFSPDGLRIAAERWERDGENIDIWIYGITQPSEARLTSEPAPDMSPVWSPTGDRIAYASKRGSVYDIYSKTVDATEPAQLLFSGPGNKFVDHWSPDQRHLTSSIYNDGLWLISAAGDPPQKLRATDRADRWQSEFSPDGRWLAYTSTDSGALEVYVEPFPATGARYQVSTHGGAEPHWRTDTNALMYLDPSSILTMVPYSGPGWKAGAAQPLFRLNVPDIDERPDYAISPDGRFLVVNTFVADPIIPPIEVVMNWTALVSR
jgi:Tol biopolymer transport system component